MGLIKNQKINTPRFYCDYGQYLHSLGEFKKHLHHRRPSIELFDTSISWVQSQNNSHVDNDIINDSMAFKLNRLSPAQPQVFKVKYIMGPRGDHQSNDLHPYLNKFKTCALTGLNVTYGDGTSNTTYDRGSMTQYTIALSLSELSPIYADEYDENDDLNAPTTGY